MDVQLPDGTLLQGVPDGTTRAQILAKLQANSGAPAAKTPVAIPSAGQHLARAASLLGHHPLTVGVGMAENALSGVTAGAGSLADAVTGADPGTHDFTYQPRTQAGKEIQSLTAQEGAAVGKAYDRTAGTGPLATTLKERVPEALGAVGTVAGAAEIPKLASGALAAGARQIPGVRPIAARVAQAGEETAAIRAADQTPVNANIVRAKELGIKLPPSEAGGAVGRGAQALVGKLQAERSFSQTNAPTITRIAKNDVGLDPKAELTEDTLDRLKTKPGAVYERVKSSGKVTADDAYRADLQKVRGSTLTEDTDFPEDTSELVDKEIAKFNVPGADARSIVGKIRKLREKAAQNFKGDADHFELARAQKGIADSMEGLLDRHLSATQPGLIGEFRAARQQFAKIYNLEGALGDNGHVVAAALYRMQKRGVPLSGGLKDIADLYGTFGKYMRHDVTGHTPFSRLDVVAGGLTALAHPGAASNIATALMVRPLTSAALKSRPYQWAGIKPREVKPSVTARVARKIAGPTLADLENTQ